jgi:hypothetical protein
MTDKVLSPPAHVEPVVFTRDQLDWLPWLEPMAEQDLTARHMAGLVDAARAKSPYFRLLARDPEVLEARTRTDKDIFYNPEAGLPRAERELAAAATSRYNGCIYCASASPRPIPSGSMTSTTCWPRGWVPISTRAGTPSSRRRLRSPRRRSASGRSTLTGCARSGSTRPRSST